MNVITLAWISGLILTLAAWGTLYRIWKGPSLLDRVLASDVLLSIITASLCLVMVVTGTEYSLILLVAISLIGFVGSVTVARFADNSKADEATPVTTVEQRHRRRRKTRRKGAGQPAATSAYRAEDVNQLHHEDAHPERASRDQGE